MRKLIIDGNSVFEIDEECLKRRKVSKKCGLDKYIQNEKPYTESKKLQMIHRKNS